MCFVSLPACMHKGQLIQIFEKQKIKRNKNKTDKGASKTSHPHMQSQDQIVLLGYAENFWFLLTLVYFWFNFRQGVRKLDNQNSRDAGKREIFLESRGKKANKW